MWQLCQIGDDMLCDVEKYVEDTYGNVTQRLTRLLVTLDVTSNTHT